MDAMQDVFVQVLKKEKILKNTAPSSLLYTIATNICLNLIRSEKRRPQVNNEELLVNIANIDHFEKRVITVDFLDTLFKTEKDTTKTIAVLHYVDGLTLQETAEQIGLSVSGVRKRLRVLRKKGLALQEA